MTKQPLSLAFIDIDRFKTINDSHGHQIGDRVLLCAAMWLGKGLRHTDFIARYGGEEFAVLFRDARLSEVDGRMTQVLGEIATRSFEYELERRDKHGPVHRQRRRGRVEPGRDAHRRCSSARTRRSTTPSAPAATASSRKSASLLSGLLHR